jgi:arabinogalactan endo-1,4-beta-galactosidase
VPWRGVDCSFLPQYEQSGVQFFDGTTPRDALALFASRGINLIRLRTWHTPADGWCNQARTVAVARRATDLGMSVLLDIHYSDSWADPGKQSPPAAWAGLSGTALEGAVYSYSRQLVEAMIAEGVRLDMVQVGNEIIDGMLWPMGRISAGNWNPFVALLKAGIAGCLDGASESQKPRIMVHIDRGGDTGGSEWFFANLVQRSVNFDIIGLSYYPWWHGTLGAMRANIASLAQRYGKPIFLAEVAYPWSLGWNDGTNNFVWQSSQLQAGYSATLDGQSAFMKALVDSVAALPGRLGHGLCYWAPEYLVGAGIGTPWENLALFNFTNQVLPALSTLGTYRP